MKSIINITKFLLHINLFKLSYIYQLLVLTLLFDFIFAYLLPNIIVIPPNAANKLFIISLSLLIISFNTNYKPHEVKYIVSHVNSTNFIIADIIEKSITSLLFSLIYLLFFNLFLNIFLTYSFILSVILFIISITAVNTSVNHISLNSFNNTNSASLLIIKLPLIIPLIKLQIPFFYYYNTNFKHYLLLLLITFISVLLTIILFPFINKD